MVQEWPQDDIFWSEGFWSEGYWADGYWAGIPMEPAALRGFTVPTENRTFVVRESRTFAAAPTDRTFTVRRSNRTYTVPPADRTLE